MDRSSANKSVCDHTNRVTLYHHDGTSTGAWQCIAASVPFDPESVRIAAEKAVEPSSTAWNAGWFAVVAYKAGGLAVILR